MISAKQCKERRTNQDVQVNKNVLINLAVPRLHQHMNFVLQVEK